jgi:hypothetical protein
MSGLLKTSQVLTDTLSVSGVSNFNGAMYNAVRSSCILTDTTAATATTSKAFVVGTVIRNTGSMYNPSFTNRVYFPVNGYYTITHVSYCTATILTSLTLNTVMTVTGGISPATPVITIGSTTLSTSPAVISSTFTGYFPAGAYITLSTTSSLLSSWNASGLYNHLQAVLTHWV